jgi:hypothetical protein
MHGSQVTHSRDLLEQSAYLRICSLDGHIRQLCGMRCPDMQTCPEDVATTIKECLKGRNNDVSVQIEPQSKLLSPVSGAHGDHSIKRVVGKSLPTTVSRTVLSSGQSTKRVVGESLQTVSQYCLQVEVSGESLSKSLPPTISKYCLPVEVPGESSSKVYHQYPRTQ